jgi:hypothetical protein
MQEYVELGTDKVAIPPMPFIRNLNLVNPITGENEDGQEAIVDTGADYTCLPLRLIRKLDLPRRNPDREMGPGEDIQDDPLGLWWLLRIEQKEEGLALPRVYVRPPPPYLQADEFILGRDVLNTFHILLRPTEGLLGELDIVIPSL